MKLKLQKDLHIYIYSFFLSLIKIDDFKRKTKVKHQTKKGSYSAAVAFRGEKLETGSARPDKGRGRKMQERLLLF